jgi:predicted RNase H-like HicB family nuclease
MTAAIALIHKETASDYGVSFPDFSGCVSAGTDLDDARRMGAEALALHIEGLAENGEPLPEPSTLEAVMADAATFSKAWVCAILNHADSAEDRWVAGGDLSQ